MILVASLFNQLLQHFPRAEFAALVKQHEAERNAKGFACWTQFVAMMFCQLAHADSLREICNGLACSEGKLVHLGIAIAPNKSTLSYANEHRPAALFPGTSHGRLGTPSAARNDAGRTGRVLGGRFATRFRAANGAAPGGWTPRPPGDGNRTAIPANNADQERGVDVCQRGYQLGARMGGCKSQTDR